jgi:Site-specific recombinase XerD
VAAACLLWGAPHKRHSVATYLLEIGIPIEEVSAWLGHSSIATTAKIYAHVNIGIRKNAAKTMDRLLGFEAPPEQTENIETVLSNLFQSLLNDIKTDLERINSTKAPVRSETVSVDSEEKLEARIKFHLKLRSNFQFLLKWR